MICYGRCTVQKVPILISYQYRCCSNRIMLLPLLLQTLRRHAMETLSALPTLYERNPPITSTSTLNASLRREASHRCDRWNPLTKGQYRSFWYFLWCLLKQRVNLYLPGQNGCHFADNIFKCISLNEKAWLSIKILLKFVPTGSINNIPALVQIMAWCRTGSKPLSEPMMT